MPVNVVSRYEPCRSQEYSFPWSILLFYRQSLCFLLQWAHTDVVELPGPWWAEVPVDIRKMPITPTLTPGLKENNKRYSNPLDQSWADHSLCGFQGEFAFNKVWTSFFFLPMKWGDLGYIRRLSLGVRVLQNGCGEVEWIRYRQILLNVHVASFLGTDNVHFCVALPLHRPQFCLFPYLLLTGS